MATHEQIVSAYESYLVENESFETKNVKAAAARARKALGIGSGPNKPTVNAPATGDISHCAQFSGPPKAACEAAASAPQPKAGDISHCAQFSGPPKAACEAAAAGK